MPDNIRTIGTEVDSPRQKLISTTMMDCPVAVFSQGHISGIPEAIQYILENDSVPFRISFSILSFTQSVSVDFDFAIDQKFDELHQKWLVERNPLSSSVTEICTTPAYQAIIAMGWLVVPRILSKLESECDHWFWALEAITGENPIPDSHAGSLDKMAQAWLDWGRAKRLVKNRGYQIT